MPTSEIMNQEDLLAEYMKEAGRLLKQLLQ